MSRKVINVEALRTIVKEELKVLQEEIDHAAIKDIVTSAQKLLAAVEVFKTSATPDAINAVTPQLSQIAKTLEDMLNNPGSYVSRIKKQPKKVTLKPVKTL